MNRRLLRSKVIWTHCCPTVLAFFGQELHWIDLWQYFDFLFCDCTFCSAAVWCDMHRDNFIFILHLTSNLLELKMCPIPHFIVWLCGYVNCVKADENLLSHQNQPTTKSTYLYHTGLWCTVMTTIFKGSRNAVSIFVVWSLSIFMHSEQNVSFWKVELFLPSGDRVGRHLLIGPWCNDWDLLFALVGTEQKQTEFNLLKTKHNLLYIRN